MSRVVWFPNLLAPGSCQLGNLNCVGLQVKYWGQVECNAKETNTEYFLWPLGIKTCQSHTNWFVWGSQNLPTLHLANWKIERWTYRILIWTKEAAYPDSPSFSMEEKLRYLLHPRSSCSGWASPDQGGWGQKRRRTHNPSQPPWPLVGRPTSFKKLRGRNHIWRNVQ